MPLSVGAYEVDLPDFWGDAEIFDAPPLRRVIFGHSGVTGSILVGEGLGTAENVDLYLREQVERFAGTSFRDTIDVFGCRFDRAVIANAKVDEDLTGSVRVHATLAYGDMVSFRLIATDPVDPSFDKLCFSAAVTAFTMLQRRGRALFGTA